MVGTSTRLVLLVALLSSALGHPAEPARLKKRDGTVLLGRVARETDKGVLFEQTDGVSVFVPFEELAELSKGAPDGPPPTPPPAPPAEAAPAPKSPEQQLTELELEERRSRLAEEAEDRRLHALDEAQIEQMRARRQGLHLGAQVLGDFVYGTRGPDLRGFLQLIVGLGVGAIDFRLVAGALAGPLNSGFGGVHLGGELMLLTSRVLFGFGVVTGLRLWRGGVDTPFVEGVLYPLVLRFGPMRQLEVGLRGVFGWGPEGLWTRPSTGRSTWEECVASEVGTDYCRHLYGGVYFGGGLTVGWLFL